MIEVNYLIFLKRGGCMNEKLGVKVKTTMKKADKKESSELESSFRFSFKANPFIHSEQKKPSL